MGVHGGAQELIVGVDVASALLLLIGVYLSASGLLRNGFAAALWTAITLAPILFGAARFLGMA
jgi:hypothetical protein